MKPGGIAFKLKQRVHRRRILGIPSPAVVVAAAAAVVSRKPKTKPT